MVDYYIFSSLCLGQSAQEILRVYSQKQQQSFGQERLLVNYEHAVERVNLQ